MSETPTKVVKRGRPAKPESSNDFYRICKCSFRLTRCSWLNFCKSNERDGFKNIVLAEMCDNSGISVVKHENMSDRVCFTWGRKVRDYCSMSALLLKSINAPHKSSEDETEERSKRQIPTTLEHSPTIRKQPKPSAEAKEIGGLFHADYLKFMNELLSKDYASRVQEPTKSEDGKIWYLPHHGIYHPKKPNKLRVVCDCSAKYIETSLNDQLMQGPDLTNSLVGVLLRFRQAAEAFTADIESMFYQVRVPSDQRDFLRFLWRPEGNLSNEIEEYQMNVHIFGAVSSPSCANFCLKQAADDSEIDIGTETCNMVRKNFYVDDCLRSEQTEDEAIDRISVVKQVCSRAGFRLTKFVCNRQRVMSTIPEDERANQLSCFEMCNNYNYACPESVLGVD